MGARSRHRAGPFPRAHKTCPEVGNMCLESHIIFFTDFGETEGTYMGPGSRSPPARTMDYDTPGRFSSPRGSIFGETAALSGLFARARAGGESPGGQGSEGNERARRGGGKSAREGMFVHRRRAKWKLLLLLLLLPLTHCFIDAFSSRAHFSLLEITSLERRPRGLSLCGNGAVWLRAIGAVLGYRNLHLGLHYCIRFLLFFGATKLWRLFDK